MEGREASYSQMISSHLFGEPEPLNGELPQCFSVFVFSLQVEQNSYRGLELGISLSLSRLGSDKPSRLSSGKIVSSKNKLFLKEQNAPAYFKIVPLSCPLLETQRDFSVKITVRIW